MPHQCTTCGHVFADGSKEMLSGCPECGGNTFQFHPKGTEPPEEPPDADPPEPEGSSTANTVGRAATKVRDFVSSDAGTDPDSGDGSGGPAPGSGSADSQSTGSPTADAREGPADTTADATGDAPTTGAPDPNATWPSEDDDGDGLPTDEDGIIDADAREAARAADAGEDGAQAAARGGVAAGPEAEAGGPEAEPPPSDSGSGGDDAGLSAAEDTVDRTGDQPEGRVVSEPDGEQPDIAELREQLNDQFESIKILEPGQYELNLMELYDREEYIIALQENGRYVIQVPEQWLGDRPGDA
jgi:predicted  nucleic acid-binding Zn-ribbon protein